MTQAEQKPPPQDTAASIARLVGLGEAEVPVASLETERGRLTIQLGGFNVEIVNQSQTVRTSLTMCDGRWQVRIFDASPKDRRHDLRQDTTDS